MTALTCLGNIKLSGSRCSNRASLLFFILSGYLSVATSAVIFSNVSTRELSVGDRVHLSVTIMCPKGGVVVPPEPSSSFGTITVKEWNSRKFEQNKADSLVFEYAITTYKAEPCTIPALSFVLESKDVHDTLKTEAIPLTIVPQITTDSADIMDLRPQQVTGKRPLLWLWLLIAAIIATAAILVGRYYFKQLQRPPPPPPPKPPYEEAMEALEALESKHYLQNGLVREYVFALSDILKRYIERRFSINAAEFTTEEMLAWLGISPLAKEQRTTMEWFFRTTDPVKFAKMVPDKDTIDRFGAEARAFIEATKPAVEPETKIGDQPKGNTP
jgi:hypothetical protein